MSKKKQRKKYEAKPKTVRINGYFNKEEVRLIDFVATKLLHVSTTQFVKGAAIEMAQATLRLAQEKADAERTTDQEVIGSNEEDTSEQSSDSTGASVAVSESEGRTEGTVD